MLPKTQRLNLKIDFQFVLSSGQRQETLSFKLYWRQTKDLLSSKVGIALSSKYFKKAVLRNKARRVTSGVIQSLYPNLNKDINLVIMPKSKVLELSPDDLKKELKNVKIFN